MGMYVKCKNDVKFYFCIKDLLLLTAVSALTQTSFSNSVRTRLGLTAKARFLTILSHLGLSFQKDIGPDSPVPSGCFAVLLTHSSHKPKLTGQLRLLCVTEVYLRIWLLICINPFRKNLICVLFSSLLQKDI